jgi:GINS complex subunit 2
LKEILDEEEQKLEFAALPFQWLEISSALLDRLCFLELCLTFSASDDIVEPDLTRRLLRDLREVRQAKARKGIETLGDTHLQMDNLGIMEINEIRFLSLALDQLRHLNAAKVDPDTEGILEDNGETTFYAGSTWED